MKKTLSNEEVKQINGLIADVEKKTSTQIVLAVIQRSDVYAEIPWKAFALGASIAGLFVLIWQLLTYGWDPTITGLVAVVGTLGGGAILALLTLIWPQFARQFLSEERSEVEVHQYAESMFLSREVFGTSNRIGMLILVSLFERKVVIVPDKGLRERFEPDKVYSIINEMTPFLKRGEIKEAFKAGLEKISENLGSIKLEPGENELPDDIIEEKGV